MVMVVAGLALMNRDLILAVAVLVAVVLTHYGYYFVEGNSARIQWATIGLQGLIVSVAMVSLMFRRIVDPRAVLVMLVAFVVSIIENLMIFVCGGWYAFVYSGPAIRGDKCEAMMGHEVSRPVAFTLATLSLILIPKIWNKKWYRTTTG
jgi:hypothetical protein